MGKVYIDFRRLHPQIRASSNKGTFYGLYNYTPFLDKPLDPTTPNGEGRGSESGSKDRKMFILKIRPRAQHRPVCRLFVSFRCGAFKKTRGSLKYEWGAAGAKRHSLSCLCSNCEMKRVLWNIIKMIDMEHIKRCLGLHVTARAHVRQ